MWAVADHLLTRRLGEALRAHDAATGEHSRGVVRLSLAVAEELGVDGRQLRLVELGAMLHDVGKLAVPRGILTKPGPLDEEEWTVMRRHTITGQELIEEMAVTLAEVGEVVRASHERWNGHGYPDGLAGEAIPLAARIVVVADAHDAMTSDRPYRRALPAHLARDELRVNAGTQFDPAVVDAALAVLARD